MRPCRCAKGGTQRRRRMQQRGHTTESGRRIKPMQAFAQRVGVLSFASLGEREDAYALRERLHRLDASAGFCGVPALLHAASALRAALGAPAWPHSAILEFLAACERARVRLAR